MVGLPSRRQQFSEGAGRPPRPENNGPAQTPPTTRSGPSDEHLNKLWAVHRKIATGRAVLDLASGKGRLSDFVAGAHLHPNQTVAGQMWKQGTRDRMSADRENARAESTAQRNEPKFKPVKQPRPPRRTATPEEPKFKPVKQPRPPRRTATPEEKGESALARYKARQQVKDAAADKEHARRMEEAKQNHELRIKRDQESHAMWAEKQEIRNDSKIKPVKPKPGRRPATPRAESTAQRNDSKKAK